MTPFAFFRQTVAAHARARTLVRTACLVVAGAPFALALACEAETGPDAPPRKNGCIDLGCPPVETATPGVGRDAGPDGG